MSHTCASDSRDAVAWELLQGDHIDMPGLRWLTESWGLLQRPEVTCLGMDHATGVERQPEWVTTSARVCRVEARDEGQKDLESTLPLHPSHRKAPEGVDGQGRHPPCLPLSIQKRSTPVHTGSHPEVPCEQGRMCT